MTPQRSRLHSPPIRVLVADDHDLFGETLAALLGADERMEVVGRAVDGAEAIRLAHDHRPDVVLMDVHMPRVDGIQAVLVLRSETPWIRVVMLSSSPAVEDRERSRRAGAVGYLTKDADVARIKAEVMRAASLVCPLSRTRAA